jgi:hypothetical protein
MSLGWEGHSQLPKRRSNPPQRLTASRMGLIAAPGALVCSDTSHDQVQSSCDSSRAAGSLITTSTLCLPVGGPSQTASDIQGDVQGIPLPPESMAEGSVGLNRFTFQLHFPDGGEPTLICSAHDGMLVSVLRHRVMTFLEAAHAVHLLVGLSWEDDVLEHGGTITDRFFPGTHVPCPFLQQGSNVNVYFVRGEDVDVTRFELMEGPGSSENEESIN